MDYEIGDITRLALAAEPTELRTALDDILAVKLGDALDQRREQIAQRIFNEPSEEVPDEDEEDTSEIEEIDDSEGDEEVDGDEETTEEE